MTVQSAPAPAAPALFLFLLFTGDFVCAMVRFLPTIRVPPRRWLSFGCRLNTSIFVDWTPGSVPRTTEYSTRNGSNLHQTNKKKAAPKGRSELPACAIALPARLAVTIDRNCRPGGGAHLNAMLYATEIVRDIPVIRPAARNGRAALNVLAVAIAASARIGA